MQTRVGLGFVAVLGAACVPPPNSQPSYQQGAAQGAPQQGVAQQPGAQTGCMQLLGCFQQCTEGQCYQDCQQRSDAASQQLASAILACAAGPCANAGQECVQTRCSAEIDACNGVSTTAQATPQQPYQQPAAQPAAQPTEQMLPGQPHTTANILPWMVGNWESPRNFHFTFYPDGRVKRSGGVPRYTEKTGEYACVSIVNETGTVRQEGDLLIMVFDAASAQHCGNSTSAPSLTVRYRIKWYQYNGPVELMLTDIDIDCSRSSCNLPMIRR